MPNLSDINEEVELGDLENEAGSFIPKPKAGKQRTYVEGNMCLKWVPMGVREFLWGLGRVKLMLALLAIFIVLLVFLGWVRGLPVSITVPKASGVVAKGVAEGLAGTAIPKFVLTYAPIVLLDNGDTFYPSDLATHVSSTHATLNFTPITGAPEKLSLDNLDALNELGGDSGGESVYLTSTEPLVKIPKYLHGKKPDLKTLQTKDAVSAAVVVVDKGKGTMDAFYMYFYTFNQGPTVFGHELGDHLGDWEHTMVRFVDGLPRAVWYSQHEYGEAYTYDVVPKTGVRPLAFSAKGSHANYVKAGSHDLHKGSDQIPKGIAFDHTSVGPIWDPTLSAYFYTWSTATKKFTPATEDTPVNYLYFQGKWGDQEYGDEVEGQDKFHDFHKFTGGPQGPLFKHLDRVHVCLPTRPKCMVKRKI